MESYRNACDFFCARSAADLVPDDLVLDERLAEGLPRARVADGLLHAHARVAVRHASEHEALEFL